MSYENLKKNYCKIFMHSTNNSPNLKLVSVLLYLFQVPLNNSKHKDDFSTWVFETQMNESMTD